MNVMSAASMSMVAVVLVWLDPAPIAAPANVDDTVLPVSVRLPVPLKSIVVLPRLPVLPKPMNEPDPVVPLAASSVVSPMTLIFSVRPLELPPPMLAKLSLVPVPPVRCRPPTSALISMLPALTKIPAPLPTPALPPCRLIVPAETFCRPVPSLLMSAQEPPVAALQLDAVPTAAPPVSCRTPVVAIVWAPELLKIPAFWPATVPPRTVMEPLCPALPAVTTWLLPVM